MLITRLLCPQLSVFLRPVIHHPVSLSSSCAMSTTPLPSPPPKPGIPSVPDLTSNGPASLLQSLPPSHSSFPFPLHGSSIDTHADDGVESTPDIAPPLHPTTTFYQSPPYADGQIYSRVHNVTRLRVESILGHYEGGSATTYASGLAAATALIHAVKPRRVYSEAGYHGVKGALGYWKERQVGGVPVEFLTEGQLKEMMEDTASHPLPPSPWSGGEGETASTGEGGERVLDLIWLEAPNNPYATLADIGWFAAVARKTGACLVVDSTLSTPLGMQPLSHGAHVVMHATTKYFSGHSDLLGGVLITRQSGLHAQLQAERVIDGAVMGNLECWLLLRSLRTFHLRVKQQTGSVMRVVEWLEEERVRTGKVLVVHHPCLPHHPSYALSKAYLKLPPATFAVEVRGGKEGALKVARGLRLFHMATSLGGVESLVDWRFQYDSSVSQGLLRMSVGVEEVEDLLANLQQAFEQL